MRLGRVVKDILFPIFCVSCRLEGEWWCEDCWQKYRTKFKLILRCPACGKKTDDGSACRRCRVVSYLDKETAFLFYQEKNFVARLIKVWKYGYAEDIKEVWEKVMRHGMAEFFSLSDNWYGDEYVLVPIPLHPKRMAERGFNQAYVLADILSAIGGWKIVDGLSRTKYTSQQARLDFWARRENIKGAFIWGDGIKCPTKIILVDDVFTSGITTQEAAKVLKVAGAEVVEGITLARGEMKD